MDGVGSLFLLFEAARVFAGVELVEVHGDGLGLLLGGGDGRGRLGVRVREGVHLKRIVIL